MKLNKEQLRVLSDKITKEYIKESYDSDIQKKLDSISEAYDKSEYKTILDLFDQHPPINKIISVMDPDFNKKYGSMTSNYNKGQYSFRSNNISLTDNYYYNIHRRVEDILILVSINPKTDLSDIISSIVDQLKAEDEKINS